MKWYLKLLNKLGIYTKKQYETEKEKVNDLCNEVREYREISKHMENCCKDYSKEIDNLTQKELEIKSSTELSYSLDSEERLSNLTQQEFNYAKDKIIRMATTDLREHLEKTQLYYLYNDHQLRLKLLIKVVDLDD